MTDQNVRLTLEQRDLIQYHLPEQPVLPLLVLCERSDDGELLRACITDQYTALRALYATGQSLTDIAAELALATIDFTQPWSLQPVHIAKPWGQEIWYTGIEARGVAQVVSATGCTPLHWAIAVAPQQALGHHRTPNLLKILDPLPDEVFGDLYFELHEEKREVYVVTHVDERAWPDGVGAIRFGFCPQKQAGFASRADFVAAYREAVRAYRAIRQQIDTLLDACRQREGIGLREAVSAAQTRQWLAELSPALLAQERALRETMDSFTRLKPLRVGDVLAVPLRTPHALQHGVRTVEFQTPVYERQILSFAQKVLTQDHWDTDAALANCCFDTPADMAFSVQSPAAGVQVERIVSFADFTVDRYRLSPASQCDLPVGDYQLVMAVQGTPAVCGHLVQPEQALLLPRSLARRQIVNAGDEEVVLLLAQPTSA